MNNMLSAAIGRVSFDTAMDLVRQGARIVPDGPWGHTAEETVMLLAEIENPEQVTAWLIEQDPQVAVELLKIPEFPRAARVKAWEMLCSLNLDHEILEAVVLAEAKTPTSLRLARTSDMIRLFGAGEGEPLTSEQGKAHLNWAIQNQVPLVEAVTSVFLPTDFFTGPYFWAPENVKSVDQFLELLDASKEFNKIQLKALEDGEEDWDEEDLEELKVPDRDVNKYTLILPTKALQLKLDENATLEEAHIVLKELLHGTPWDVPAVHAGTLVLSGKINSFVECLHFMNNHVEYVDAMYSNAVQAAITVQLYDAHKKDGRYVYTPKEPHFWTAEDLEVAKELAAKYSKFTATDSSSSTTQEDADEREIEVLAGQILDGFNKQYTMQALVERDASLPITREPRGSYLGVQVENYDYLLEVAREFKQNPSDALFEQLERAIYVAATYTDGQRSPLTFDNEFNKLVEVLGSDTLEEQETILKLNQNTGMLGCVHKGSVVNKFLEKTLKQVIQHVKLTGEVHPVWKELLSYPDSIRPKKDTSLMSFLLLKKTHVTKDLLEELVEPAITSETFSFQTPGNLDMGKVCFFLQKVKEAWPEFVGRALSQLLGAEVTLRLAAETSFFQDNWDLLNGQDSGGYNWLTTFNRGTALKLVQNSAAPISALNSLSASEAAEFFMPADLSDVQLTTLCDLLSDFAGSYAELLETVKAV